MSVSTPLSSSSPANVRPRQSGGIWWGWLLVAVLLLVYVAPWMTSGSAALTFGGYDLGEWASLPPGVRSQAPPLVASFLLRLPLTMVTLYLAFALPYRRLAASWLMTGVICLLLVVAQLPPLEFFTVFRGDPNYGQQATLALVSGIGALLGLATAPGRWRWLVAAVVAAGGAVAGIAGMLSARELMAAYQMEAQVSVNGWLAAVLFAGAAVWAALRFVQSYA